MTKYWWVNILPFGYTKEELRSLTALVLVAAVIAILVASVGIPSLDGLGIPSTPGFLVSFFGAFAAGIFAARPLMTWLNPELIKKGDDANAARVAAEKSTAKG